METAIRLDKYEGLPRIEAQPGPQIDFLATGADIAIFGGAAGGGKTFALLMEMTRHIDTRGFGSVIFRRNVAQVRNEGGLWDESHEIFPFLGATPREISLQWVFPPYGCRVKFAHMQYEKDKYQYDGSQIPLIAFDQLEHFTAGQFFYMLSRNRSMCGIKPYVRATCNPDPDSFLREFLRWWIDDESGYPIKERSGRIRWFVQLENETLWADTPEELTGDDRIRDLGVEEKPIPKSVTFIPSSVTDNKILLRRNPEYLANLMALPLVERERLRWGNWNIRESAGNFFRREWFEILDSCPRLVKVIRYWDRAASSDPTSTSATAGLKMGMDAGGAVWIPDLMHFHGRPAEVKNTIRTLAEQDGKTVTVGIEQDPGQAGVMEAQDHVKNLAGFKVVVNRVHESKGVRAKPLSAQAEAGNVKLVRGPWNEGFLQEAENFDGVRKPNDRIDAASGAYQMLTDEKPRVGPWGTEYANRSA